MINSILNRYKDLVKFDNIKLDNNIITNTHNIKAHIQKHFDQWTGLRTIDQTIYNQTWQNEYQPLDHINSDWYQSALLEFSIEEVSSTLAQLPNNKACGPSGISYEMLKHTGLPSFKLLHLYSTDVLSPTKFLNNGRRVESFQSLKNQSLMGIWLTPDP